MNAFTDITVEEQVGELLKFTAARNPSLPKTFADDQAAKYKAGKQAEVLRAIIDVCPSFFARAQDNSEGVFNALIHLLGQLPKEQKLDDLIGALTTHLMARSAPEHAIQRLKIMVNLFNNLRADNKLRYNVFTSIFTHSADSGLLHLLNDQMGDVERWVVEWNCDVSQKRGLYKTIYLGLKANKDKQKSTEFLTKYMSTFNGEAAPVLQSIKEDSIALINATLSAPDIYEASNLLLLDGVKQLKGEKVFALVEVYCSSDLEKYQQFVAANQGLLKSLGLSEEEVLRKVRLMALTSLCANNNVLEFAAVAKALQIPDDDVESWVIDVVRAGLVEAKLDELNEKIVVSRSTHTAFGITQWQDLLRRLQAWQTNLSDVQNTLENVQSQIKRQIPGR